MDDGITHPTALVATYVSTQRVFLSWWSWALACHVVGSTQLTVQVIGGFLFIHSSNYTRSPAELGTGLMGQISGSCPYPRGGPNA